MGLETVFGKEHPPERTVQVWPILLQEIYKAQRDIGWEQIFYGRIHRQWANVAEETDQINNQVQQRWTGRVIRHCWTFGLEMLKMRNDMLHGTEWQVSNLELERAKILIRNIFQHRGLFSEVSKWEGFPTDFPPTRRLCWIDPTICKCRG